MSTVSKAAGPRWRLSRMFTSAACAASAPAAFPVTASHAAARDRAAAPSLERGSRANDAPDFRYADVGTLTHRSTSATGEPITVSGTVTAPKNALVDS
ncbi:hypothetical protein GCM10023080_092510 [Streptomyces pseudoechinosporeus]